MTLVHFYNFAVADKASVNTFAHTSQTHEQVFGEHQNSGIAGSENMCIKKKIQWNGSVFHPSHNVQIPYLSIVNHYFYQCFQFPPIWWMKTVFCFILHFWLLVILNIFLDFIDHLCSFFWNYSLIFCSFSVHFLFAIDLWALLYSDIKHLLTMLNIFLLSISIVLVIYTLYWNPGTKIDSLKDLNEYLPPWALESSPAKWK